MKYDLEWQFEMIGTDGASTIEVMVDYDYSFGCEDYFAYGSWNPGDSPELEITRVAIAEHIGPSPYDFRWDELCLIPAEQERVETYIINNPPDLPSYEDDY